MSATTVTPPAESRVAPSPAAWAVALRGAAPIWAAGQAAVLLAAAAVTLLPGSERGPDNPQPGLNVWDTRHYLEIATDGYTGAPRHNEAFYPGFPMVIRAVTTVLGGRHPLVAAWLVAAAASLAAAMLLWYYAADAGLADPSRAVAVLWLSPLGLWLSVPYAEPLFLLLVLATLRCVRGRRWWWVGLLCAAAVLVRAGGVPLTIGAFAAYLVAAGPGPRAAFRQLRRGSVVWVALPAATFLGFQAYLTDRTGRAGAQARALAAGWDRRVGFPWTAAERTVGRALGNIGEHPLYAFTLMLEAIAVLAGVVLAVRLLRARRGTPAEPVYVALCAGLLACVGYWGSAQRALLTYPALSTAAATRGPLSSAGRRAAVISWFGLLLWAMVWCDGKQLLG